jgi:hypothetical protein
MLTDFHIYLSLVVVSTSFKFCGVSVFRKETLEVAFNEIAVVGRAGFEFAELKATFSFSSPATHRFLFLPAYFKVVCLIG